MAIIIRGINRLHEKSKIFISICLIIILAMSMIALSFIKLQESITDPLEFPTPIENKYITFDTILIDGNDGFTNASGVTWGSGTIEDPYIIENLEIIAADAHGIEIRNSDVYFIIRSCHIYNGGMFSDGMYLHNCSNGYLYNNNCSWNMMTGITLHLSRNNILCNNTCSVNTGINIGIISSNYNTLINNTCRSGGLEGIRLVSSNNNIISNNHCLHNHDGITLLSSHNNALSNNTCELSIRYGLYLISSDNNTLSGNTCSYNDDGGIYLSESSHSNLIYHNLCSNNEYGIFLYQSSIPYYAPANMTSDRGGYNLVINNTCNLNNQCGVILLQSSNNTISNNTCSLNNQCGIIIDQSSNNTLSNNTCGSNNLIGIKISDSNDNKMISNNIFQSSNYGLMIELGFRNEIWNNTFIDNNGAGIIYNPIHIQAYDSGSNNRWNSTEGYGNNWSDWQSPDYDFDGIVDNPYYISGSAIAKDHFPCAGYIGIPEPPIFILTGIMIAIFLIFSRTRKKN